MAEAVAHRMGGALVGLRRSTAVGVARRTPMVALVADRSTKAKRVMLYSGSFWLAGSRQAYIKPRRSAASTPQTIPAFGVDICLASSSAVRSGLSSVSSMAVMAIDIPEMMSATDTRSAVLLTSFKRYGDSTRLMTSPKEDIITNNEGPIIPIEKKQDIEPHRKTANPILVRVMMV